MKHGALEVYVNDDVAGRLDRSSLESDVVLFGYRDGCPTSDAISLTMPVVRDQYDSMGTVHPIFEMNLPEGALRQRLHREFAKVIPELDDLDLLGIVGASQIGRLRYAAPGASLQEVPAENIAHLLTYDGAEDLFSDLLDRYARYSGISGMQPKVLVRDERGAVGRTLDRVTRKGATHIVKAFNPADYELAANEFFCLEAARHAGLPVPAVALSQDRKLLIVERFDLHKDGQHYLGFEDFCVLNGLRSAGRYDGSYESIVRRIRQFVSVEQQATAVEQFFAMLALSCAVENGDAHLKNFGILYEQPEGTVSLAPVYDVIATTLYLPRDILALTLAGSKRFPSHDALVTFGRNVCNLGKGRVQELMEQVAHGVAQAITDLADFANEHLDFAPCAEKLINVFERGTQRSLKPA